MDWAVLYFAILPDKSGVLKVYNADALKITPPFKEDFSKFYNALGLKIIF